MKSKVLFVGIHNSGRSQMAEAMLNRIAGHEFEALSAGLDPAPLNPLAVEVMRELGLDISNNKSKWIYDFITSGKSFAYVITVCEEASAARYPKFNGNTKNLHWTFPDLSALRGTPEEQLARAREVRDMIKATIILWCREVCSEPPLLRPGNPMFPGQSPLNP
jgi:arsenate reductase